MEDLDCFQELFFNLVNETQEIQRKLNKNHNIPNRIRESDLIEAVLMPFKCLINTCLVSDLVLPNDQSIDLNAMHDKFTIISARIPEIQRKLYGTISTVSNFYGDGEIVGRIFDSGLQALTAENTERMLNIFEENGLSKCAEQVLDTVWKMSIPLISVNPPPFIDSLDDVYDWRNIIKPPVYSYVSKTARYSYKQNHEG